MDYSFTPAGLMGETTMRVVAGRGKRHATDGSTPRVRVGVIMNGVTGRMGANQHLVRSILAIQREGGVQLADGRVVWPDPILIGRSERKVRTLAEEHGVERWATDLEASLADEGDSVYFDALATRLRPQAVRAAIAAGKHVYCEKPLAGDVATALDLAFLARQAGVKTGVVQDKLFLPGLRKLRRLVDSGFFGRLLSVRIEFGYWVFPGEGVPSQRPAWNYKKEEGGGILLDMYSHWRYVVEDLFGPVRSLVVVGAVHIPERVDEHGRRYTGTAEDAAYGILALDGGVVVQVNSSWTTRVRRDDLLTLHVDGTDGSAVAGLRDCWVQPAATTPKAIWNPDLPQALDFRAGWQKVPDTRDFDNGFKLQWELFLRHVTGEGGFPWDFLAGARGVQLAELAMQSWRERRWVDVPDLVP